MMSMLQLSLRQLKNGGVLSKTDLDFLKAQFESMLIKEVEYQCSDYILTHSNSDREELPHLVGSHSDCDEDFVVDDICRQKMCEWSYRIVDHFNGSRELVAIAQNYVDRFLDQYRCDCTAYKLASITALYLAVKVHNTMPVSMQSLADLSKGEFLVEDIAEMEMVLLKALDWNMSPPTASCFCGYFQALLPHHIKSSVRQTILQRSRFFSELSVMDYSFTISVAQSEVAFGGILNSLAGLSTSMLTADERRDFIKDIEERTGMNHSSTRIKSVQEKLWMLYRRSSQYKIHDLNDLVPVNSSSCIYERVNERNIDRVEVVTPVGESSCGKKGSTTSPVCIISPE